MPPQLVALDSILGQCASGECSLQHGHVLLAEIVVRTLKACLQPDHLPVHVLQIINLLFLLYILAGRSERYRTAALCNSGGYCLHWKRCIPFAPRWLYPHAALSFAPQAKQSWSMTFLSLGPPRRYSSTPGAEAVQRFPHLESGQSAQGHR